MSIGSRKFVIASIIVVVLPLANAGMIVGWLENIGVIPLARGIRAAYLIGTTTDGDRVPARSVAITSRLGNMRAPMSCV